MIRAVFTDVDGTLLNSERQLSRRTIHAIRSIADKVTVVLASSRMPSAMRHLQLELNIAGHPLVCYNGGYVLASGADSTVYANHVIPLDVCRGIVAYASGKPVHISLYHADNWYAVKQDKWTDKEERVTKVSPQFKSFDAVLSEWEINGLGAHKVMCMGEAADIASFYEWLREQYADRIHIYKSRPTYLELATKQVSKASGMELIMSRHLKASLADAIAFGDNYNDVEMLREAGIGVAVDNAIQDAKEIADEITTAGEDDGVARSLEKHFGVNWNS
ncbi:HAD family hydrolase [Chryseolinea sp. T2]|uniref:HAD family hydrolase n=1 Tax=Chryseolinea sp. T2 TaxID=3129255 RepID=UPI003077C289